MEALTRRFEGIDEVINTGEKLPDFDYYANLMSLPRSFGNDPKLILAYGPYVKVDEARVQSFRQRLDRSELNVGIVWGGNPTHLQDKARSIPLRTLAPLIAIPGVRIVSLQKGEAASQLHELEHAAQVRDWGGLLENFADTADAIAALDLVISVDTSVAHLAGALEKPAWILLPTPAEWRWMDERRDSDWYRTAKLFRQPSSGDWEGVVQALIREIVDFHTTFKPRTPIAKTGRLVELPVWETRFAPPSIPPDLTSVGEAREGIFQFSADPKNYEGVALSTYGEWHHEQLALLSRLVKLGQSALEYGAGTGVHSVALSRLIGSDGHLIVYESNARARRILAENLQANKARNVTVMQSEYPTSHPPARFGIKRLSTIYALTASTG